MRPGLGAKCIADEVAEFFNLITRSYQPLEKRGTNTAVQVRLLEAYEVADRLRKFKKPKSMLYGDIYPDMVASLADIIAIPLTDIFNEARTYQK